jgi:hypothetical protein
MHGSLGPSTYVTNEEIPGAGSVTAFEMKLMTDPTIDPLLTAYAMRHGPARVGNGVVHYPGWSENDAHEMYWTPGGWA